MMRIGSLVLGASIAIAMFSWWPDISKRWRALETILPPIHIPNATATWVNVRQFDIKAPTYSWNDTCEIVSVAWWVQTRTFGPVPVTTKAVIGPFKNKGALPPRYEISIKPTDPANPPPPLQLRVTIPDWLPAEEVVMVAVDDTVPDNRPCTSGWFGVMQVFRLEVQDAPH
jgi:hypothetical protein